jgi:iron(III) transport system substrate-binding protein
MKFYIKIIVVFLLVYGCDNNTNEVVVYTSVDQVFSEPILKAFESQTGIHVKAVFDTEETKSTGVLNRLIAEKNNTQCDVFWSGDPLRSIVLKNKGITQVYRSDIAEDINPVFKDKEAYWIGFSARARVLIYNKKMTDTYRIPQSIFDLTKEHYKNQVTIANPLFGTTTFHIAALFEQLGDEKAKLFLKDLKKNGVVIATSNGDVKRRVMQSEVFCGLTDTDDAFEAIKESGDVGLVFLDQNDGIGSLIMPNTLSILKNAPHTENAKKLFTFLLSRETEQQLAQSCAQMPLHKGVSISKDIPSLDHIQPMKIDYQKTAEKLETIQSFLKEWVEN